MNDDDDNIDVPPIARLLCSVCNKPLVVKSHDVWNRCRDCIDLAQRPDLSGLTDAERVMERTLARKRAGVVSQFPRG